MIAVQLWFRCSVPGCDAQTETLTELIEFETCKFSIQRNLLADALPEGWELGSWYSDVVVCPTHSDRRDDHALRRKKR